MMKDIEQGHQNGEEVEVPATPTTVGSNDEKDIDPLGTQEDDDNDNDDDSIIKDTKIHSSLLTPEEKELRSLLAQGACHLPGNESWVKDWLQYFRNNHPFFAIFLQNRLHPIPRWMRAVGTFGSIMFGLVTTNIYFLFFVNNEREKLAQLATLPVTAQFNVTKSDFEIIHNATIVFRGEEYNVADYTPEFEITAQLLILWTVGAAIHAIFDNFIWYVTACSCILDRTNDDDYDEDETNDFDDNDDDANSIEIDREKYGSDERVSIRSSSAGCVSWMNRHRRMWNVVVVIGIILITAAASLAALIRANVEAGEEADEFFKDFKSQGLDYNNLANKDNLDFLTSYAVEVVMAWLFWFPVIETILFSGILSCGGRLPFGGGRPAEVRAEQQDDEDDTDNNDDEGEHDAFEIGMSGEVYHVTDAQKDKLRHSRPPTSDEGVFEEAYKALDKKVATDEGPNFQSSRVEL